MANRKAPKREMASSWLREYLVEWFHKTFERTKARVIAGHHEPHFLFTRSYSIRAYYIFHEAREHFDNQGSPISVSTIRKAAEVLSDTDPDVYYDGHGIRYTTPEFRKTQGDILRERRESFERDMAAKKALMEEVRLKSAREAERVTSRINRVMGKKALGWKINPDEPDTVMFTTKVTKEFADMVEARIR